MFNVLCKRYTQISCLFSKKIICFSRKAYLHPVIHNPLTKYPLLTPICTLIEHKRQWNKINNDYCKPPIQDILSLFEEIDRELNCF